MSAERATWLSMESAPKDGSLFVIFHTRWKNYRIVQWRDENRFGEEGWFDFKDDGFILRVGQNTHFVWSGQVLPPAPPAGDRS